VPLVKHDALIETSMEDPCCTEFPELLPPPDGDPIYGKWPIHWASWRMNAAGVCFLATDCTALPADKVDKDDLDDLFPGYEVFFPPVVSKVLQAASGAGVMNHWMVSPIEEIQAQRLLSAHSVAECEWAADAVAYLIESGCYTEDHRQPEELRVQLKRPQEGGSSSANTGKSRRSYEGVEFDLFAEDGKGPVGEGKLNLGE
jgi:hypothetical protein